MVRRSSQHIVSSSPATGTACRALKADREACNSPTRAALLCRANWSLVLSYELPKKSSMRTEITASGFHHFLQAHTAKPHNILFPPNTGNKHPVCTKPMHASTHAHRQPCTCKHTSYHLTESPAAYPSPNRSMYCREDVLASVGQVHTVLWGQGRKMRRKTPQTQLSPLLPLYLFQDW